VGFPLQSLAQHEQAAKLLPQFRDQPFFDLALGFVFVNITVLR
jgi:hypothetical protein